MQMKIYLDLVLILNFLFDLLLLFATGVILRRQTDLKKLLLGSLIGSVTIISLFIPMNSFILFLVKVFISIIMVIITFGYKSIRYTIKNMFYLYTSSIILGGFLYFLNLQFSYQNNGLVFYFNGLSINFIALLILSPIIIYAYTKQLKEMKTNYSNYYNIDLYLKNGQIIPITGFLDTGNKLTDPYKQRPIILVNKSLIKIDYESPNILLVPYDSLNNHGILKCIIPDKIFIQGIGFKKNFLVGISNEKINIDGIDCILNTQVLEGK
jgi:stage II sporulation protein GA (sporulation sigma-E factor processing peptidase)